MSYNEMPDPGEDLEPDHVPAAGDPEELFVPDDFAEPRFQPKRGPQPKQYALPPVKFDLTVGDLYPFGYSDSDIDSAIRNALRKPGNRIAPEFFVGHLIKRIEDSLRRPAFLGKPYKVRIFEDAEIARALFDEITRTREHVLRVQPLHRGGRLSLLSSHAYKQAAHLIHKEGGCVALDETLTFPARTQNGLWWWKKHAKDTLDQPDVIFFNLGVHRSPEHGHKGIAGVAATEDHWTTAPTLQKATEGFAYIAHSARRAISIIQEDRLWLKAGKRSEELLGGLAELLVSPSGRAAGLRSIEQQGVFTVLRFATARDAAYLYKIAALYGVRFGRAENPALLCITLPLNTRSLDIEMALSVLQKIFSAASHS